MSEPTGGNMDVPSINKDDLNNLKEQLQDNVKEQLKDIKEKLDNPKKGLIEIVSPWVFMVLACFGTFISGYTAYHSFAGKSEADLKLASFQYTIRCDKSEYKKHEKCLPRKRIEMLFKNEGDRDGYITGIQFPVKNGAGELDYQNAKDVHTANYMEKSSYSMLETNVTVCKGHSACLINVANPFTDEQNDTLKVSDIKVSYGGFTMSSDHKPKFVKVTLEQ